MDNLEQDVKDFRARTPIPEDPNEERTLPEIKEADTPKPSTSSTTPELPKTPTNSILTTDPLSPQSSVSRAASPDIPATISRVATPDLPTVLPETGGLSVASEPVPIVSRAASPEPQKPKETLSVPIAPIQPLSPGKSKATGRKIAGWL